MSDRLPRIAVCACGAEYPRGPLVRRDAGGALQVECPGCGRRGPRKHSAATAIYAWNEDIHGIKNPRGDLLPHLDSWRPAYFPMRGKGER